MKHVPPRIAARPDPADWGENDLLTLREAAALLWPDGPLTETSLRTAVRDGLLDIAEIAGKILTTRAALRALSVCRPRGAPAKQSRPHAQPRPSDLELLRAMTAD